MGTTSVLFEKKGKYYISVTDKVSIFHSKKPVRIEQNEEYYIKYNDEYKNMAVLHKCYEEHLNRSVDKVYAHKQFLRA